MYVVAGEPAATGLPPKRFGSFVIDRRIAVAEHDLRVHGLSHRYAEPISIAHLKPHEYRTLIEDPFVGERIADHQLVLVVVAGPATALPSPGALPIVAAYVGDHLGGSGPPGLDVVVDRASLDQLTSTVTRNPIAASSLAILLRSIEQLDVESGLAAESAVYSVLQSGGEFAAAQPNPNPMLSDEPEPTVVLTRTSNVVTIELNRPHRHNAITRQMRDELCVALATAALDDTVSQVIIEGRGPSFCSGGDLSEFGARHDPATAHRVRLAQSPARLLHRLRDRLTVRLHGAALGGGIEMAAFAHRISAHPTTRIGLPEVAIGLIPGAGGTVSITRRIGRQRCAALALTATEIDPRTALRWGLVDHVDSRGHPKDASL